MTPHHPVVDTEQPAATPTLVQDPRVPRPSCFALLAPAQSGDEIGRLGGFRVLRLIGEGGMGMVFEAEDPALGRRVALKVMRPEYASRETGRLRFLREAKAAAALKHDHIVPIYQVGEDGGVPYLVMPLLQGESLANRLQGRPKLSAAEAARIAREAVEGLGAAHDKGLVHRDVKPSNLWLEPRPNGGERVLVFDFGLARPMAGDEPLTGGGYAVGTPGYMAPEQARAEAMDGRTDLFSLGCVLYRMCTGKPAFPGGVVTAACLNAAVDLPPAPHVVDPTVPLALSELVMRLLAKDPADRPESARATADALAEIERGLPSAPTLPQVTPNDDADADTAPKQVKRPWPRRIAVLMVVVLVVGATGAAALLPRVRVWLFPTAGGAAAPLKGYIDVRVNDPTNPRRQNVHLSDPDVLPLKPGDAFAVEAQLNRPAYMYIFWIDADGTVKPVYPWTRGHWNERPADEQPTAFLRRPEALDRWYTIKASKSGPGMDTLFLLARETPLPADVDLPAELGKAPSQTMQTLRSVAWFENGMVVRNEPGREGDFDETRLDDPVLAAQEQVRTRLGGLFPYTRAVSFADGGK